MSGKKAIPWCHYEAIKYLMPPEPKCELYYDPEIYNTNNSSPKPHSIVIAFSHGKWKLMTFVHVKLNKLSWLPYEQEKYRDLCIKK